MSSNTVPAADQSGAPLPYREFIALLAWLMAMTALSIDIMLPALPDIGRSFNITTDNDRQMVVTAYLVGLAIGQLIWGHLSDRAGRRLPLLVGLGIYVVGSIAALLAPSFLMLIAARVCQAFIKASMAF